MAAEFSASPESGEAPLTVQFTDESTGDPTAWSWAFGDGDTSELQNPSHVYDSAGPYTPVLEITVPVTWAVQTTPAGLYSYYIFAYSSTLGVVVGLSYRGIMASLDGETWVDCAEPAPIFSWQGVAWGSGRFIAVSGDNAEMLTSLDGFVWTKLTGAAYYGMYDVTYGGGYFFGNGNAGGGTNRVMYSTDGLSWTIGPSIGNNTCYSKYANSKYIFLDGYQDLIHYSDDILSWNTYDFSGFATEAYDLIYGNNVYILVYIDLSSNPKIGVSSNLTSWTEYTIADISSALRITFTDGLFYVTTNLGVYQSADGQTWEAVSSTSNLVGIIAIPDQIIAGRTTNNAAIVLGISSDTKTKTNHIVVNGSSDLTQLDLGLGASPNPSVAPADISFTPTINIPDRIVENSSITYDRIVENSAGTDRIIETTIE